MNLPISDPLAHLRELTAKLKINLSLCADPDGEQPSVDAVHDVRTGTRRIEAILDSIESSMPREASEASSKSDADGLAEAIARWRQLLRKIRRSAGAVRDLDVHRKLLDRFLAQSVGDSVGRQPGEREGDRAAASPSPSIRKQAEDLDAWLKHTREEQSQPLVSGAQKWAGKLEARLAAVSDSMLARTPSRRKPASPAVTALEAFARLCSDMQELYADNLHDFRKGAKKARYMAEAGGSDAHSGAVGKALKRLQDEIGDWHDWLVLAGEAHRALGNHGGELIALIEAERESHYAQAMKTSERMRGRLMGEWRATAAIRRRTSTARSARGQGAPAYPPELP